MEEPLLGRYLETMTWIEAEEAFKQVSIVMIPIGQRLHITISLSLPHIANNTLRSQNEGTWLSSTTQQ